MHCQSLLGDSACIGGLKWTTWLVLDLSCGKQLASSRFPGGAGTFSGLMVPRRFINPFISIIFVFYS